MQGQEHAGGTGEVRKLFVRWFGLDGFKLFGEQSVLDVPDIAHVFVPACLSARLRQYVHQAADMHGLASVVDGGSMNTCRCAIEEMVIVALD